MSKRAFARYNRRSWLQRHRLRRAMRRLPPVKYDVEFESATLEKNSTLAKEVAKQIG